MCNLRIHVMQHVTVCLRVVMPCNSFTIMLDQAGFIRNSCVAIQKGVQLHDPLSFMATLTQTGNNFLLRALIQQTKINFAVLSAFIKCCADVVIIDAMAK